MLVDGQRESDERAQGYSAAGDHSPPRKVSVEVNAFIEPLSNVNGSVGHMTAKISTHCVSQRSHWSPEKK